jgi:TonB family protein
MPRMILTSLILLPVLAFAQAGIAGEVKPSASSANVAELTVPNISAAATPGAAIASSLKTDHAAYGQWVRTQMIDDFAANAMRKAGTLEYAMFGDVPTEASAPQVTRAVELQLSQQELDEQPKVSNVVVRATVDPYGFPRNLSITQSGGSVVDKRAVEAISQYRFKPATRDNQPIDATVLITIKIQKR